MQLLLLLVLLLEVEGHEGRGQRAHHWGAGGGGDGVRDAAHVAAVVLLTCARWDGHWHAASAQVATWKWKNDKIVRGKVGRLFCGNFLYALLS